MSSRTILQILQAIKSFDNFTPDNDPYGEHDFGEVHVNGERVWFKIEYYDKNMEGHTPDPADDKETHRVITIMYPEEY